MLGYLSQKSLLLELCILFLIPYYCATKQKGLDLAIDIGFLKDMGYKGFELSELGEAMMNLQQNTLEYGHSGYFYSGYYSGYYYSGQSGYSGAPIK